MNAFTQEEISSLKHFILDPSTNLPKNGKTYESVIKNQFPKIYSKIDSSHFRETLFCLLYDLDGIPKCPVCGTPLSLKNFKVGFFKTCSKECSNKLKFLGKSHQSNIKENNLKSKYPDLDISFDSSTSSVVIHNYCKHGDLTFKDEKVLNKLHKNNLCLCDQCKKDLVESYIPTDEEVQLFQAGFSEFRKKYANVFSEEWFIRWFPKELKIIQDYSKDEKDLSLIQRCVLFENHQTQIPECNISNCHEKVKWCQSQSRFLDHCEKHVNYNWQSKGEKELKEFIRSLGIEFQENKRGIISSELDIYIPSKNLAIEFNGLFWHSEIHKSKNYHYEKWKECKEKGIKLIQVWEDEWNQKREIIEDIIRSSLGLNKRIFARKCEMKEIEGKIALKFLEENHIQGYCQSSVRLGLEHEGELVALMTFGRSRFKKDEYELLRFCCQKGYNVIGGAGKLLNYFLKNNEVQSLVSYANCSISNGNLYEKLGFENEGHSLNYWWSKNGIRVPRYKCMKTKLVKIYPQFKNKSEDEIMHINGFYKIYGPGNIKFKIKF